MSVTAKVLIPSKYASSSTTAEYTAPASTRALIDKFTATNTDTVAQTISVYLVPSGGTAGASNLIVSAHSIAAGATADLTELKNHVLQPGDFIAVVASTGSKIVERASGREAA